MPDLTIIGHRGAMAYETENSISSFEKGIRLGSQMLEFDVHVTKDGEVIVMHDDSVTRTTNGWGSISQMTLGDIKALKLKNGEQIPTLREVLGTFKGRCGFNVEIKGKGANLPSYRVVKELGMLDDVIFSAFNGPLLLEIKSRDSKARIACLARDKNLDIVRIAKSLKAEAIHPVNRITTKKLVEKAHSEGLLVNVWTVNRVSRMKKLLDWGVDGIFTNKPDVLASLLTLLNTKGRT